MKYEPIVIAATFFVLCIQNSFSESFDSTSEENLEKLFEVHRQRRNINDNDRDNLDMIEDDDVMDVQRKRRNTIPENFGVQPEDYRAFTRQSRNLISANFPNAGDEPDMISGLARESRDTYDKDLYKLAAENREQLLTAERNKRQLCPPYATWCRPPPRGLGWMRVAPNRYNYRRIDANPYRTLDSDEDELNDGLSYRRSEIRVSCIRPPCDPGLCNWENYKPVCCMTQFGYCNTYNNLCLCEKSIGSYFIHNGRCHPNEC